MPRNLYYTNGQTLKSLDLPQYPDESWDWITGEPDSIGSEELYSSVAAVYRAANITANALANIPFALVDSAGEDYDISSDWENKVGFMPNPRELLRLWRLSLFMTGSAYGFMEGNRAIKSLRYIVPSTITPIVDTAEGLQGFKRTVGSATTRYSLKDRRIFYMFRMDHTTELLPSKFTEFRALMAAAGVLYYADYFTQNFFQRGGIKPTMLMVKGVVNPTDREKIENIWDKVVHGWHKYLGKIFNADALEPHVIGEGIDNIKDSSLHEEKIADIAMAAGMPLSLLLSNSATYATAQTEYMMWFRDHIPPWADFMADCMNDQLFKPLGLRLDFRPEVTDPGQEDEEERAGAYRAYVSTGMKPSIAAQILGIELPPGMEYDDLDVQEEPVQIEEVEPTTDTLFGKSLAVVVTEDAPEPRFIPSIDQLRELELWQSLAFRKLKRGDDMAFPFELKCVPEDVGASIRASLAEAQTEDDVRAAFDIEQAVPEDEPEDPTAAIKELAEAINAYAEKYSPDQPRVPAGNPEGGQWTSGVSVTNDINEKNYAGGWKSKDQPYYDKAYDLGVRAREKGYTIAREAVWDNELWDEIKYYDNHEKEFFHSGLLDEEKPYPVVGWRQGRFSDYSYNAREDRREAGVSCMEVWKVGKTQDEISAMFITAKKPEVRYLRGYLVTRKRGGDGEPLIFAPEEITADEYKKITGYLPTDD